MLPIARAAILAQVIKFVAPQRRVQSITIIDQRDSQFSVKFWLLAQDFTLCNPSRVANTSLQESAFHLYFPDLFENSCIHRLRQNVMLHFHQNFFTTLRTVCREVDIFEILRAFQYQQWTTNTNSLDFLSAWIHIKLSRVYEKYFQLIRSNWC